VLLGVSVSLAVAFGSLTAVEYYEVNDLTSQLHSTSFQTLTSTVVVTSTAPCPSTMICGTFSSSPNGEVRVESVEMNLSGASAHVAFWVTIENIGTSPIHFANFDLNFSIPSNSSVLRRAECQQCFPGGSDITANIALDPGKSYTLEAAFPNTKDYYYYVVQAGTFDVNFDFNWTGGTPPNSTTISAGFVYP
jgi:hypothetical protein